MSTLTKSAKDEKVMSLAQIEKKYDSEWVLLADPVVDKHLRIRRGRVVCHSKDRDSVYSTAAKLRLKHTAFLYTGKMPKDAVIVL